MVAALGMSLLVLGPVSAHAADPEFAVVGFTTSVTDANGDDYTQAGGHPFAANTSFAFTTRPGVGSYAGLTMPVEDIKDVDTVLPPGFVGDPQAAPQCTNADVVALSCPIDSQVGTAMVSILGTPPTAVGVYNVTPQPGYPAEFGMKVGGLGPVFLFPKVRSDGDYGLTISAPGNGQAYVLAVSVTFWGVPADPRHDAQRLKCVLSGIVCFGGQASHSPMRAFLTNPSDCDSAPPVTELAVNTWQQPNVIRRYTAASPRVTGCDQLEFKPSIVATPDSTQASAPVGYDVNVHVPQNSEPLALGTPPLRNATVALPAGVVLNPSVADGLAGCTDEQFGEHSGKPGTCPEAAKIGQAQVTTPLLDHPLHGSVYVRQPDPGADITTMYAIFLDIEDEPTGLTVKLRGKVTADPVTGQLTARFVNNPQMPFSDFALKFKGGSRAPLANPQACGTYNTAYSLLSWSGITQEGSDPRNIDGNCDAVRAFAPVLDAGLASPKAAGSSPFTLTLSRPDGQQDLSGLDVTMPAGVLGRVGSVPRCAEAQAAAGTCPSASQVGTVTAASGAGATPVSIPQAGKAPTAVYLAGPYKGAPFSLSIVVPAQAGPFDLGNVVVRAALFVDPVDAHVTVKSDPLPTMLAGVPLRVQRITVKIDRPGFMVAPSSCAPSKVDAQVSSSAGATAAADSRFQVGECAALDLKPKLKMELTGKGQTTDNKHPALTATLTQTLGQSNLKKVTVTLPLSMALDPDNSTSDDLCEFKVGQATVPECPASSIIGTATAKSPVLDEPLTGPVYFVKNVRIDPKSGRQIKTLPALVTVIRGAGVTLVLRANSNVVDNKLVTTFDNIPDAPVSSFKLDIKGGEKGILVVSGADLCKGTQIADQEIDGQNGETADAKVTMSTPCSFGVVGSSRSGNTLNVTVGGIGAGRVAVSGPGLSGTSRTIAGATTATLRAKLGSSQRSALARGRDVRVRVKVSFTPTGAKKAKVVRKTITIHGAKKAKR
jgi:hypothetical protein